MSRGGTEQPEDLQPGHLHWAGAFWSGFDSAAVGMALVDAELELVEVNRALAGLLDVTARQVVGAPARTLAHDDDADSLERLLLGALEGVVPEGGVELALRSDQPGRRAVVSASCIPDEDGGPAGLLVHVQDVTSRRAAEEALRISEQRFRLMVDSIEDYAVFMLDPDGRVATWNSGAQRLKGYDLDDVIGQHFRCFYTPEDRAAQLPEQILSQARTKGSARAEGWRQRKDGSRFWAEVSVAPVVDDEGQLQGFAKVTHDVSQRRQAEEQLRQAQRLEALGRLAGGVAHDFNNLLAAILGYSEVLQERLSHEPAAKAEIQQIHTAAERARDLVAQLLAFSRNQETERGALPLVGVVAELEPMLRRLVGDHVDLRTEYAQEELHVVAERGGVEQILMNLVANAADAVQGGGSVTIGVRAAQDDEVTELAGPGGWAVLSVTDTGAGMSPEVRERAFDPFFTTKSLGRGTGLGLSLVFGVVRQNGGHVHIDSVPGDGTTVLVLLPRATGGETVAPAADAAAPRPPIRQVDPASATILLVEDEEPVRSMLNLVLTQRGYGVLEAGDGMTGLAIARRHGQPVDLVITDVSMPRMNGPDLVTELRKEGLASRAIYISGFTARALEIDPEERFLQKPFSLAELLDAAAELLDGAR